jgi:hypothetical protein
VRIGRRITSVLVTLRGDRVTVVLNDRTVIENVPLPGIPPEGPVGLQYHGDEVEFANLFVREFFGTREREATPL